MKECKHCKKQVVADHYCETKHETIRYDNDFDFMTSVMLGMVLGNGLLGGLLGGDLAGGMLGDSLSNSFSGFGD